MASKLLCVAHMNRVKTRFPESSSEHVEMAKTNNKLLRDKQKDKTGKFDDKKVTDGIANWLHGFSCAGFIYIYTVSILACARYLRISAARRNHGSDFQRGCPTY